MPQTLVTGANGFVASHVIDALIAQGHTVIGSLRDANKGSGILKNHSEWEGKLSFVSVADYTQEGVWDEVFEKGDFDYVVHVAAPVLDNPKNTDFERDFAEPSIKGNTELLKSATKYGKNLKAISVTGSINAITTGDPEDLKTRKLTSDSWNFVSDEDAIKAQNSYISYCAGKKVGELAIWEYVKKETPDYSVTVLLPPIIFGPPIQDVKTITNMNWSNNVFYSLWNGTHQEVPPTAFPAYIDVRDLANAHIMTLTADGARNKRFLVGNPISFSQIVDTLKGLPELEGRLPKDKAEEVIYPKLETEPAQKAFGMKYRTAEETFFDEARTILELEKKLGHK